MMRTENFCATCSRSATYGIRRRTFTEITRVPISAKLTVQSCREMIKLVVLLFLVQFAQGNGPGKRMSFTVVEEQPVGVFVGQIPTESGYLYSFNEASQYFHIDSRTGRITTLVKIDREQLTSDKIDALILGKDRGINRATIPIEVTITILDINDNSPTFPNAVMSLSIQENAKTQKLIDTAVDKDFGSNGTVSNYKIIDGNDDNKFKLLQLTSSAVYLSLNSALNRELIDEHNLTIQVQDDGHPTRYGYLRVKVTVTDINDNPPSFDLSDYTVEVSENIKILSDITQVHATDSDSGLNAELYYEISDDTGQFAINRSTGVISTVVDKLTCLQSCQTCKPLSCFMTVTANDRGNPPLSGRAYVTVYLLDENDHAPVIKFHYLPDSSKSYSTVEEDAVNKVVALVTVTDADYGINADTNLEITAGNDLGHFYIQQGRINLVRVRKSFDRMRIAKYNLTLTATDKGTPVLSATANLIILIKDVNKDAPNFEKDRYHAILQETIPKGSFVKSIVAKDSDGSNSQLKYAIVSGNTNEWFSINEHTGLILTDKALDFEEKSQVVLNISVKDSGLSPQRNYTTLTIDIIDENDVTPHFSPNPVTVSRDEGPVVPETITSLTATDPERGSFGTITYLLASETEKAYPNMFKVNLHDGSIALVKNLDRENVERYIVKVIASDQAVPPLSSTGTLIINVNDINDNAPVIYPIDYYVTTTPNKQRTTNLVQIQATDADTGTNGDIVYSILANGNSRLFHIDRRSGWLSSISALSEGQYQLKVIAKDLGTPEMTSSPATVNIVVKVDQSIISFHNKSYIFYVTEDQSGFITSRKIGMISAVSKLQTKVTFKIHSGDPMGVFDINNSGEILSRKAIDREASDRYNLVIVASDGENFRAVDVHVWVRDVNDNHPTFSQEVTYVEIDENWAVGHDVIAAVAVDKDYGNNANIFYSGRISGDILKIDRHTGLVSINKPLFPFVQQELVMDITAVDNGKPALSSSAVFKFLVTDVNDHTPSFANSNYEVSLEETVSVNKKILELSTSDQDYGVNSKVYYEISRGNDGDSFGIFPDGWLYVAKSLDRETTDLFMLTVIASDRGTPRHTSSTNITILISDVNDNKPKFSRTLYSFSVAENSSPHSYVGRVTATDLDIGENADFLYSCLRNEYLDIDPFSGVITTKMSFDREQLVKLTQNDFVTVDISVEDRGTPQLRDTVTVKLTISDVNDNGPKFAKDVYYVEANEKLDVNSIIATVAAIDPDNGENARLKYGIVSDTKTFRINENNGDIMIAQKLDRESIDKYVFVVTAMNDANGINYTASATVFVTVEDDNDNHPRFSLKSSNLDLTESSPAGTFLAEFVASDSDHGINARIWYSITRGNEERFFKIDKTSGKLYLAKTVDYETHKSFVISVTALDFGIPSLAVSTKVQIKIHDANDNSPVFRASLTTYYIKEEQSTSVLVGHFSATDADELSAGKLVYFLAKQSPFTGFFDIDRRTGSVYAKPNLDREQCDSFNLTIAVIDQGRRITEKHISIVITDVNDNPPEFVSPKSVGVDVRTLSGTKVAAFSAIDRDSGNNADLAYEMTSGNKKLFRLDPRDGSLYLESSLNNQPTTQNIVITARDKGFTDELGQKSATSTVTLFLYNGSVTDSSFSFDSSLYSGTIRENQLAGTTIVTLQTTSSVTVHFYITSVTSANSPHPVLFDVNKITGVISNAVIIDREKFPGPFTLQVTGIEVSAGRKRRMMTSVQITVTDENDSPPYFVNIPNILRVAESHPTGRTITKLIAADPDTSGQLSFTIQSVSHEGVFAVDQQSGEMGTLQKLDSETHSFYSVTIRVSDGVHQADALLTVLIDDVNDNSPIFSHDFYSFEFPENSPIGSIVGRVEAVDADDGNYGTVAYKLESVWGANVFNLDPVTGLFTITGNLDYEEVEHYILTITATDLDPVSPRTTTVTVYMNVVDINDNDPVFQSSSYSAAISEDIAESSEVLTVMATDVDSGLNSEIHYSIVSGDNWNHFNIHPVSGLIITAKALDRETIASYNLIVVATDHSRPASTRRSSSTVVIVTVTDVNDEVPIFVSPNVTSVMENFAVHTPVYSIEAVDPDEGVNSQLKYTMEPNGHFYINSSGTLFLKEGLDREINAAYDVTVHVTDKGTPRHRTSLQIRINVLDDNDNKPKFINEPYAKTVSENIDIGSSLIKLFATDADVGLNGMVTYYIVSGDDNNDFSLDPSNGLLRVQKKLDYEQTQFYKLIVHAKDYGSPSLRDSATVSIAVTDVNDNVPVFYDSPFVAYIQENIAVHPVPVIKVAAYDRDSAPYSKISYTIRAGDGQNDMFSIDSTSGEISILRQVDREMKSKYEVTVIAKDSGSPPLTGTGTVRVLVQDDNDNTPVFSQPSYTASVTENDSYITLVTVVKATDKDSGRNSDITYTLLNDYGGIFKMDATNGSLSTTASLDREVIDQYEVIVVASDRGLIPRTALVNVTIFVKDVNDNSPKFQKNLYRATISSLSRDDFAASVLAIDDDIEENGRIRYTMSGGDSQSFYIDAQNGVIKAKQKIVGGDKVYSITVHATDQGSPSRSNTTTVSLSILPPSRARRPVITSTHRPLVLSESTGVGHIVATVTGYSSKPLTYFIAGGNVRLTFSIVTTEGKVMLARHLDYEQVTKYDLYIGVRDNQQPPMTSFQHLVIEITDINDNQPIFSEQPYQVNLLERSSRFALKVEATDADAGDNGRVEYSIVGGNRNNAFGIDPISGIIRVTSPSSIDREQVDNYALLVLAKDKGVPMAQSTWTSVEIHINDINDSPPRFTRQFSISIPESSSIGSFILRVTSSDDDIGRNAIATYSLSSVGNDNNAFAIDSQSGNISVNNALDAETKSQYVLEVSATDESFRIQTTVTITISDVNDNAPQFNRTIFAFDFEEYQAENSHVGLISAYDSDISVPNNRFYYSLYRFSPIFFISSFSGHVYCRQSLVYVPGEASFTSINRHELIVVVTDLGTPPRSSKVRVIITVVDANNNAPIFEKSIYKTSAPVNAKKGMRVIQIVARDTKDFGINADVAYSVIGGNGSRLFEVNRLNGIVAVTTSSLNGRNGRLYRLVVQAQDGGRNPQSSTATVFISITDVNAYVPRLAGGTFSATIREDERTGYKVTTFAATDYDVGINGKVKYLITSGNNDGIFKINATTGELIIEKSLDYETATSHSLGITARDSALLYKESTRIFRIAVIDVNDNPPLFEKSSFDAYIAENSSPSTEVHRCKVTDADSKANAVIEFSIISDDDLFTIDQSGIVRCTRSLDYESKREYSVIISARNPGSELKSTATLKIHVTGVNEYLPKFIDPIYYMQISESAKPGTFVGKVRATDEDDGHDGIVYYYLIGESNMKAFKINHKTGEILVSGKPDYEKSHQITLKVIAKNRGPVENNNTAECTVRVSIQDANDPPQFTKAEYTASIRENARPKTEVLTVSANDNDRLSSENKFTYLIISGNHAEAFIINKQTGRISVKSQLDRETIAVYHLTVGALDAGFPPQTGSAKVTVTLLDINDNAPYFKPHTPTGYISENRPQGSSVITLSDFTFDADDAITNGAPFHFSTPNGIIHDKFSIDSTTGLVVTRVKLDREEASEYIVSVMVKDSGVPAITSLLSFKVIVEDIDDSAPLQRPLTILLTIYNNVLPTEPIANVQPLDKDIQGDQTCVVLNDGNVFATSSKCNLNLITRPNKDKYSLKIRNNEAKINYQVVVELNQIPEDIYNNVVTLRIKSKSKKMFLLHNYYKFKKALRDVVQSEYSANVVQIIEINNDLLVMVAISTSKRAYLSSSKAKRIILAQHEKLSKESGCAIDATSFDICKRNACKNSAKCQPIFRKLFSMSIIETDYFIFSSPKIAVSYKCACSGGYTGEFCEIAPCGRSSCKNGGKCVRPNACECTSNWKGEVCDIDVDECAVNKCHNGGRCVNLPGTFRCDCANGFTGSLCKDSYESLTFSDGAFIESSSLDERYNDIRVGFSTLSQSALLLYNPSDATDNFFALEIVDQKVRVSIRLDNTEALHLSVPSLVQPSKWYQISVTHHLQLVSMKLSMCVTNGMECSVCHDGDTTCHAFTTIPSTNGRLNVSDSVLHIGGVRDIDSIVSHPRQVATHGFIGCLSVAINGYDSTRETRLDAHGVNDGCRRSSADACLPNTCNRNGQCVDEWTFTRCECTNGFKGRNCDSKNEVVTFSSDVTVTYVQRESYSRQKLLLGLRTRRSATSSHVGLRFAPSVASGLLFFSTNKLSSAALVLNRGRLQFIMSSQSSHAVISLDKLSIKLGSWYNVSVQLNGDVITMTANGQDATNSSLLSRTFDFAGDDITSIILGGAARNVTVGGQEIPGYRGCMEDFALNHKMLPLSGATDRFFITVSGNSSSSCSELLAAITAPSASSGGLSSGVIAVIVILLILIIAAVIAFVIYRKRKSLCTMKKEASESHTKLDRHFTNGKLPHDIGSRSHDSGYGECNELAEDGELCTQVQERRSFELARPDIIESDRRANSCLPLEIDDGTVIIEGGELLYSSCNGSQGYPERYDVENISTISSVNLHYNAFRDNGPVPSQYNPNVHASPYYHQLNSMGGQTGSPLTVDGRGSAARQSPGVMPLRNTPVSMVASQRPRSRNSPSGSYHSQMPMNQLSKHTGNNSRTSPLGLPRNFSPIDQIAYVTPQTNKRYSSSDHSLLSSVAPARRRPHSRSKHRTTNNPYSGYRRHAKGLTIEEVDQLNSHRVNTSHVDEPDIVSSTSDENLPNHGSRDTTSSATLLDQIESSSDESPNDSFTCSEFEYGYDKLRGDRVPGAMIFSKLTEVENENDNSFNPSHYRINNNNNNSSDGLDSNGGSFSTIPSSEEDRMPQSHATNSDIINWDYLLNWGPSFEKLVGVFRDIASLPDESTKIKTVNPVAEVITELNEAFV